MCIYLLRGGWMRQEWISVRQELLMRKSEWPSPFSRGCNWIMLKMDIVDGFQSNRQRGLQLRSYVLMRLLGPKTSPPQSLTLY